MNKITPVVVIQCITLGFLGYTTGLVSDSKQQLTQLTMPTTCYVNYNYSDVETHQWKGKVYHGN